MRVLFLDGTAGFTPTRVADKASGGILTSLTIIPRILAAKGHEVYVRSQYEKAEIVDGVCYINDFAELKPDVVVFNRNLINRKLVEYFKDAYKVWWLHDIVDHRYLEDDGFRFVDRVVALSEYCKRSYSRYYEIPSEKFVVVTNGVDRNIFYPPKELGKRNGNLFVTASAPIKGMLPLPFVYQNLKRINPNCELRVYSSMKLHDQDNSNQQMATLKELEALGAKILDPIPQAELADVLRESTALLMPNHYPEICSNLLLQGLACGCTVIGTPIGSTLEFISHGENGLVTDTTPCDWYWWWAEFAKLSAEIHIHKSLRDKIEKNAPFTVLSWEAIGETWAKVLTERENVNLAL